MLQVDYKLKMGELVIVQKHYDIDVTYKIGIYHCNALAAFVSIGKAEDGKRYYFLYNFYLDAEHIKRIIKHSGSLTKGERVKKLRLNLYYKECETLLRFYVKEGVKIECYYKEPTKTKGN